MAEPTSYPLPAPQTEGGASLVETLRQRRSVRAFADEALSLEALSQLLWAAQGITAAGGLRTAPSAGALYPLELYLVAGSVAGLPAGTYRYDPVRHRLQGNAEGDRRAALAEAAYGQDWVGTAPALVVFAAVPSRTTAKYGERGIRYVHMEAGHAAQNLLLAATALELASVVVGAFDDAAVSAIVGLPAGTGPMSIVPVGRPHR